MGEPRIVVTKNGPHRVEGGVPVLRAAIAYSLFVWGSVHPQPPLPLPPPMEASDRLDIKSMFLHG